VHRLVRRVLVPHVGGRALVRQAVGR
jgi:hypothetical protein